MKILNALAVVAVLAGSQVFAADILQDFDSLGGNNVLLERAEKLNPDKKIEVVQDRTVNRRLRSEVAFDMGAYVGGDAYVSTQGLGLMYQLHINPRFSVGVRGAYYMNTLRDEGKYLIDRALDIEATASDRTREEIKSLGLIPEINYPKYSGYLVGNYYPIYGKMNILNLGIAQYDVYALGGVGQMVLRNGSSPAYTAGGGLGLWISQHLASRFEVRWETYEAKRSLGKDRMNMTVIGLTMGYLL